ncbi:MAG: alginate export family protein [Methylococcaceae bacterium]|nr:alginate export family protein [Methylococcaceae bacterium]
MKFRNRTLIQKMSLLFAPLAFAAFGSGAQAADTITEALTGGKVSANLQYRYENVDQPTSGLKTAEASTFRLRLGYETAEYKGFGAMVQIESIAGNHMYNSRSNGQTSYSVVADPRGTEINQAYLSYTGLPQTKLKYGRQVITYDNHRWIGNVVWRQNWQTYDAFTAVNQTLPDTTVSLAYINNVNRVFGESSIDNGTGAFMGDHKMSSPLVNVKYSGFKLAEITGYGYFLDYDAAAKAFGRTNSTRTLGIRAKGEAPISEGGTKLLYAAEYADQSDYGDNPVNYSVHYTLAEVGVGFKAADLPSSFKVGYELLSSNGQQSLSTPLATLFAFNGWADVFLTTPRNGLRDIYASARTNVYGIVLGVDYHDFQADFGGGDYGTEWDLMAEKQIDKTWSVGTRAAFFNTANAKNAACATCIDTDKFWLYGAMNF